MYTGKSLYTGYKRIQITIYQSEHLILANMRRSTYLTTIAKRNLLHGCELCRLLDLGGRLDRVITWLADARRKAHPHLEVLARSGAANQPGIALDRRPQSPRRRHPSNADAMQCVLNPL